jgi:phospholipid N-methyltransferase
MEFADAIASLDTRLRKVARYGARFSSWSSIGAVCESSQWLARRMRTAVGETQLPVIELGAGFGSVTDVLPETTISIERDARRFSYLKRRFPDRIILDACAISTLAQLTEPTVVVSSIPSVNNSEFDRLRAAVARARTAGTVARLVTYTYFPQNPFGGIFGNEDMVGVELLNLPPAFVWKYAC